MRQRRIAIAVLAIVLVVLTVTTALSFMGDVPNDVGYPILVAALVILAWVATVAKKKEDPHVE